MPKEEMPAHVVIALMTLATTMATINKLAESDSNDLNNLKTLSACFKTATKALDTIIAAIEAPEEEGA